MRKLVIAGAKSVFGLSEIKSAFSKIGFEVSFVDAPFMAEIKLHDYDETEPILYSAELPSNLSDAKIVPLSEFWISYCIKTNQCLISKRALKASRSKRYLYDLLSKNGFSSIYIYKNQTEAESALDTGKKIVIKPEGLHSGYGIEIIDKSKKSLLSKYVSEAQSIKNRTLRLMEIQNSNCMITECLDGTEYSADCFWCNGKMSVVRVCKKNAVLINDKPCTVTYELISDADDRIKKSISEWMKLLFDYEDVSFAQFDFIETFDEKIIPIDFASRVGGGITDLLIATGKNFYADAVRGKDTDKNLNQLQNKKRFVQFNYLPTVTGYIKNDDYNLRAGKSHIFKRAGDYVISNPSSVGSRIAVVVDETDEQITEDVIKTLLVGNQNIR